ncbi:UMTA methyltransferase family protein [Aspergillus sclerotialis]|uniref:UMTA methyltransferase family protein n=1 Tax=Aspergillus sclerotialis TaxID=2070753 RepID=A0A3A2ZHV5_9EURO|nr:UMTA methyltransferase family protein [Aspergillus sclerotialis]
MDGQKPTIAFFGATGGCANSCLVLALRAGYCCTALARNPTKLRDLLRQREIPESTIADNLIITTGDVTDIEPVKETLLSNGGPVNFIVCGIGGKPSFENPLRPTLDNPSICQDGMRTILAASRSLAVAETAGKPSLIVVSTTGISGHVRDFPLVMLPLYHWMLKVPHEDKKVMERLIREEMEKPAGERGIQNCSVIRPSLLTDGKEDGLENVQVGFEEAPAVGYTISRKQVGRWMFENLVCKDSEYVGKVVAITV